MPKLRPPTPGKALDFQPSGLPLFFESRVPRVVTADPWAFVHHCVDDYLEREFKNRASAYIEQAFDFFQAAENPQTRSKPLLYYYSFLNLAKVALLIFDVDIPLRMRHGIVDPGANIKQRVRITGQEIRFEVEKKDKSEAFPEFLKLLGKDASSTKTWKLLDVLWQVPSIHRTFTKVTGKRTLLLPIKTIEVISNKKQVWIRIKIEKGDRDVQLTLPNIKKSESFSRVFTQTQSGASDEKWFETEPVPGVKRGIDPAISKLADSTYEIPTTTILTSTGYRIYFVDINVSKWLHPLAAIYAAMFYLGSITRYKPDVFGKILSGGYAWVVEEFLATSPVQYLYILASLVGGTEVVKPYAASA